MTSIQVGNRAREGNTCWSAHSCMTCMTCMYMCVLTCVHAYTCMCVHLHECVSAQNVHVWRMQADRNVRVLATSSNHSHKPTYTWMHYLQCIKLK